VYQARKNVQFACSNDHSVSLRYAHGKKKKGMSVKLVNNNQTEGQRISLRVRNKDKTLGLQPDVTRGVL
jgi:hypothetical protein